MMDIFPDNQLRDWLLHRLEPAQAATVEEHLISDDNLVDRLLDLRFDLFDDYARGNLDTETRSLFLAHWLKSPADRDRLAVAVALAKLRRTDVSRISRATRRTWTIGALAAALMLAIGLTSLRNSENGVATSTPTSERLLPTISLRASVLRGTETTDVLLPPGDTLRLQAEIERPDATSRYILRVMDGDKAVFEAPGLSLRQAGAFEFVETKLPTSALGPGTRRIVVTEETSAKTTNATTWIIRTRTAN